MLAVLAVLAKATETTTDDEVSDILCGQSLHTSTSELFPDTTYKSAAFNEDGSTNFHCTMPIHLEVEQKLGGVP